MEGMEVGRLTGTLIKQALQITDRRLGANSEMGNQGLWRALMASLKGYNRLLVKKGLRRRLAPQSEEASGVSTRVEKLKAGSRGRF